MNRLKELFARLFSRVCGNRKRRRPEVKPRASWILFKAVRIKTASGIVLPDDSKLDQDLLKNIVRGVGAGVFGVKPGDEIIILPHARLKLNFPERDIEPDLFLVKEQEICAVIKE